MNGVYPWIYSDYKDNIWKFSRNDNKELCYRIMYREGKWTKETLIDVEVLGFDVYVSVDETIHVVYSNTKGELRYCTMKDTQWLGKLLYQVESEEFEIQNLKVEIIGDEMHIFYLLVGNDGSDHGVLMHCIWNGKETKITTIQDIILIPNLKEYYSVHVNKKGNIYAFFISDEGDEISLNYCNFENHRWSIARRLYGIQGEDIGFEVLMDQQEIHILNKSREDSIYFLDHVSIDIIGSIKEFRVHESRKELKEPILFTKSNKLYVCWLEQGKISYSAFDGKKWSSVVYFDRGNELTVERYNCFIGIDKDSVTKVKKIYGTSGLDLYLFNPSEIITSMKDSLKKEGNQVKGATLQERESIESLKLELSSVNLEKKNLEKKIIALNLQLQKNQRFIDEYEEQITRILEQKRKSDENCNIFLKLQKNIQKELEGTKKKFLEEELLTTSIQKELEYTKQQLLEERKIKVAVESKLKECQEENVIIKQQGEIINEEKRRLSEELELEKNQSIMERLLRRRTNGV
ncbi:hypothetical protein [Clostridium sp. UBA5712]|uniref:hypothetical protein n=1 Tax=Clostridium sp. UBA5712 TaxID=1946368 RepID=UPI003216A5F0